MEPGGRLRCSRTIPAIPVRETAIWVGRAISSLRVLFLALDGTAKLFKPAPVMEASAELGIPESTITGIGILLLACTAAYAVPAMSALRAVLLTRYLGGAFATHVRVGGPAFPVAFATAIGVLVWVGLYLREPRLRALVPSRRAGTRATDTARCRGRSGAILSAWPVVTRSDKRTGALRPGLRQ